MWYSDSSSHPDSKEFLAQNVGAVWEGSSAWGTRVGLLTESRGSEGVVCYRCPIFSTVIGIRELAGPQIVRLLEIHHGQ